MQLVRAGLVRPLGALEAQPTPLPTGFPALDDLLQGGLPRAALTVLSGGPSSGSSMLALGLLASAQRLGCLLAYLDAARRFDPIAAALAGLDLAGLLLARPASNSDAPGIAYDLLCEGSAGLVLLDSGSAPIPDANLRLLNNAVARSQAALVLLTEPAVRIAQADLRLSVSRTGWEACAGDLALRACVTVEAGRGIPAGRSAALLLPVDEGSPCWPASW